jgi:C4-dicarboxylate-specific signal transduction histidine kinase
MAEKSAGELHRELESLRIRLHKQNDALAKRRLIEQDLHQANARLQAEVQQLRVELQKSQQGNARADSVSAPAGTGCVDDLHRDRLRTLGELAAGLAHEVNQPLTAIATYTFAALQLLSTESFREQEVKSLLERIAAQAQRAGELIRSLRRFATRGQAERRPVNLTEIIQEALLLIDLELRNHKVQTRLELAENIPSILADPIPISQVLLNLIRNAIEAMHDCPVLERCLTIATRCTDSDVEVSVSDTGSGLSIDTVRNLFEAFHTTKPEGMGLGLSICRTIVQAHNGRLWVKLNPRRGTTFFIALPLSSL